MITVVTGAPRSGTSLMMRMLEAGGIEPLTDHIKGSDVSNPNGYYEYEPVKGLPGGQSWWIPEANGRAVKIISSLLPFIPHSFYDFRVIWMRRKWESVVASQITLQRTLCDMGQPEDREVEALIKKNALQEQGLDREMRQRDNVTVRQIDFNSLIRNPPMTASRIASFLKDSHPDLDRRAMHSVVNSKLVHYR